MSKEEALSEFESVKEMQGDPEAAHAEADRILLEYLRSNHAKELADAFVAASSKVGFWYA